MPGITKLASEYSKDGLNVLLFPTDQVSTLCPPWVAGREGAMPSTWQSGFCSTTIRRPRLLDFVADGMASHQDKTREEAHIGERSVGNVGSGISRLCGRVGGIGKLPVSVAPLLRVLFTGTRRRRIAKERGGK